MNPELNSRRRRRLRESPLDPERLARNIVRHNSFHFERADGEKEAAWLLNHTVIGPMEARAYVRRAIKAIIDKEGIANGLTDRAEMITTSLVSNVLDALKAYSLFSDERFSLEPSLLRQSAEVADGDA